MRVKRSRGGGRGSGYVGPPPPLHPPGKYEFIKIHIIKLSKICDMPHPPPLIFFFWICTCSIIILVFVTLKV